MRQELEQRKDYPGESGKWQALSSLTLRRQGKGRKEPGLEARDLSQAMWAGTSQARRPRIINTTLHPTTCTTQQHQHGYSQDHLQQPAILQPSTEFGYFPLALPPVPNLPSLQQTSWPLGCLSYQCRLPDEDNNMRCVWGPGTVSNGRVIGFSPPSHHITHGQDELHLPHPTRVQTCQSSNRQIFGMHSAQTSTTDYLIGSTASAS